MKKGHLSVNSHSKNPKKGVKAAKAACPKGAKKTAGGHIGGSVRPNPTNNFPYGSAPGTGSVTFGNV